MLEVVLTAIGVGLATVAGAGIGFLFRNISHKLSDYILGFSAGIMLCASVVGLILPSLDFGGTYGIITTILGILSGAIFLNLMDKFIPHDHVCYAENKTCEESARKTKIMLFVFAIGLHNFPEGIASGVGFGTGEMGRAIMISIGIALQNIPEGMVIIVPMLSLGFKKSKVFLIALITGLIEVVGAFIGYFLATLSMAVLPFLLAFAGGTMLYVIGLDLIPETHAHGNQKGATYALLIGFCLMLLMDFLLV